MSTPPDTRPDVPTIADERTMLDAFLDYHRATLLWKCAGLTDDELRMRTVEPSSLSLIGLVRHMVEVELSWFLRRFRGEDVPPVYCGEGNWDGEFDDVDTADVQADLARYRETLDRCRAAAAGAALTDEFQRRDETIQLRWLYLHMIEEYARHNGHADLLRERIDGAKGE
jgi:hypothetical protein